MTSPVLPGTACVTAPAVPLVQRHCRPLGPESALDASTVEGLLRQLPGWRVEGGFLDRIYTFVNATAWVTHREDHHPELAIGYDRCHVRFTTHSAGGLSENDFICAAKFDALLALC